MMMNGIIFGDNMSNLTSGSNELASISSSGRNEVGSTAVYPQQESFASTPNRLPAAKKKRNLPGNPDPDAEVVALSPRTLMATNRFICEICNKGFQRDQNLQLHRRGHNLPWKLKQRANKEEMVKKVYVCPEATCVHHEPSRALGDLTGIKKHFSRKHGEKKWKCEKCSKRYAVQSDWKAHSKICGTREYRCDCGTLFSRRDSFITHRAFCDALAEESTRCLTTNPLLSTQQQQQPLFNLQSALIPLMKGQQDLPQPWLASQLPQSIDLSSSSSSRLESNQSMMITHHPQNPNPRVILPPSFQPHTMVLLSSSPHMSATALLQKAAQMSAMSSSEPSNSMMIGPHQADDHMIAKTTAAAGAGLLISSTSLAASTAGSGCAAGLSSRQGLSFGNKPHVNVTSGCMEQMGATTNLQGTIHDMMITTSFLPSDASSTGFGGSSSSSFEEPFNGMFNPKMGNVEGGGGGGGGGNEGLSTRDFLGLRGFSHRGFSTMPGLDQINSSPPFDQRNQN